MIFNGISKSAHNLDGTIRNFIAVVCINKCILSMGDGITSLEKNHINKGLLVLKGVMGQITNQAYVRKDFKA